MTFVVERQRGGRLVDQVLGQTAELIALLRPRAYLIGNVPGLQDSTSWHIVQDVIGGLSKHGYCVNDYAVLDAADYGVPQHRVRPFWFGHLDGPCLRWPAPSHCDPKHAAQVAFAIAGAHLHPWVTCRQALQHLPIEELGRPVRMKIRPKGQDGTRHGGDRSRCSEPDRPAKTVVAKADRKGGQILIPALAGAKGHPAARPDAPSSTVRSGGGGHSAPQAVLLANEKHPMCQLDEPAKTVTTHLGATGAMQGGSALFIGEAVEHQHHRISDPDQPSYVIKTGGGRASGNGSTMRLPGTRLEPRADGHPISEVDEPSKAIVSSMPGNGGSVMRLPDPNRPPADPDEPMRTVTRQNEFQGLLTWPWDRPATTILGDEPLSVPGHHDAKVGNSSHKGPNAVVLSARAAAILQGFPDGECTGTEGRCPDAGCRPGEVCPVCGDIRRWHFTGATKKAVWSQLGQAMPPGLAEPVARAIAEQMRAARAEEAA